MKTQGVLVAVLIGLVVVLVGVLLLQESRLNIATAQDQVGAKANGVIAVTGLYGSNQSVLYLVDTNREVILTYACYSKTSGAAMFQRPFFTFLAGRSYVWDATLVERRGQHGTPEGPSPADIRQLLEGR